MTIDKFTEMYLEWVSNFLTIEKFAAYYGISVQKAEEIVAIGRRISYMELE